MTGFAEDKEHGTYANGIMLAALLNNNTGGDLNCYIRLYYLTLGTGF